MRALWLTMHIALMSAVGLPCYAHAAGTLAEHVEAEDLHGIEADAWQFATAREIGASGGVSGRGAAVFVKGADVSAQLRATLSRPLGVLERAKVFCRVLPPVGSQPAWITIECGGGVVRFQVKPAADSGARRWQWTSGQVLTPPVGGADLTVGVSAAAEAVALDLVYVTTNLATVAPDRLTDRGLLGTAADVRLAEGLTFYADFEDTLRPLIATTWPKPTKWEAFRDGVSGRALYVAKDETPRGPSYPTKGNIPFLEGSLSFWFRPEWERPKDTGQGYLHLLSMYSPGRFYLMVQDQGVSMYVTLAKEGQYGPHWVNKLLWYQKFAGGHIPAVWKKGQWNHFLFTWNEGESHGYFNGEKVGVGGPRPEGAGRNSHFGNILQVGGYQRGRFMNGSLDELAAWDRVLSADEAKRVFACGEAGASFLPQETVADLRDKRLAAEQLPEVTVRNVFRNGSFEAGLSNYFYAENPYFAPPKFFPDRFAVTEGHAKHGRRSLRITIPARGTIMNVSHYGSDGSCKITSFGLRLNPEQTFTFSCWARKLVGGKVRLDLSCSPVRKDSWRSKVKGTVELADGETDWRRLVFTAKPEPTSHGYYTLTLIARHLGAGEAVLLVDGLQVSPGVDAAGEEDFPCRTKLAGTLATPVLGNIFKRGVDPLRLEVVLANQGRESQNTSVRLQVHDLFNREVFARNLAATVSPLQQHCVECDLPDLPFGCFRAELVADEDEMLLDELSLSVMPDLGRVDCVGVHCFLCEYGLDVAARFGAQWDRLWDGAPTTKWYEVQPDGPQTFDWEKSDALVNRLLERGFRILGVLYHVQSYRRKHWAYQAAGSHLGRDLLANGELLEHWKNYVRAVVSRFRGKITYWELLNEPYNGGFGNWSPDEYVRFLRITEPVVRDANPDAKIVGPCTYLGNWCPPMLKAGLLDHLDVFSYHGYGMGNNALATVRDWARHDGHDRPIFDTENGCHAAAKFFCKSYAGREYSSGREPLNSAASMSQAILRARVHGTDTVFQYWMRPYPPYSRHGSILYCDGTPTPGAVAFGITGWMLRGHKERGLLRLGRYVDCALFENSTNGRGLAALWDSRPFDSTPESKVVLTPGDVALGSRDFMGNPCALAAQGARRIITLHTDPVYLSAPSAKALEGLLRQARVVGKGEPVYAVRATYKCDVAGAPALRIHVYNNSMDDRSGTLTFARLPEGFVLRQKSVSFSVRANREQVLSVPIEKMPDTALRAEFPWIAIDRQGLEEKGAFVISHLLVQYREGIRLDADFGEWADLPAAVAATQEQVVIGGDKWGGPKDTSATLRAVWDTTGLYFAIEVTDDAFFPPPAPEWCWDSVELFYDTDLYGDWGETSCSGDDFKYSVEAATREATGFAGPKELSGASSIGDGVRRMEIRVPLAQYGLKAQTGTAFGFDIAVDDADVEGQRRKLQILWTGAKDNYKNPSHYGVLMLVK